MDYLIRVNDQNEIEISPYALTIKQFKVLWDRDKTKTKKRAIGELSFVYFYGDIRSIYNKQGLTEEEKVAEIPNDLDLGKKWKPDELIQAAVEKYVDEMQSQSLLLVTDAQTGVNKLRRFFREVDLMALDDKGKPIYNISQFTAAIKQIRTINKELKDAYNDVLKELDEGGNIYGGGQVGIFEDPEG